MSVHYALLVIFPPSKCCNHHPALWQRWSGLRRQRDVAAAPATGNWNTPANWNPATVPNGPSDVATFSVSNQTNVSVTSSITLDSIVFQPDASAFTISTSSEFASVLINGAA
jgi:hypothetical protein